MDTRRWFKMVAVILAAALLATGCAVPPPPMAQPPVVETNGIDLKRLLYGPLPHELPGMGQVRIEQVAFRTVDGEPTNMVVYYPPNLPADARLPAVISPNVFPDPVAIRLLGTTIPEFGANIYWGLLVAADGLIAVHHHLRHEDDFDVLMDYLMEHAEELQIDAGNLGFFSCCAMSFLASSYAHQPGREHIKFTVNYYGAVDSPDEFRHDVWKSWQTSVGAFSDFPPVEAFRTDLPMLVVRAGQERGPFPQEMIDHFVETALAENLDLTLINYPIARTGFEGTLNVLPRTGQIIRQTLAFIHDSLER